MTETVFYLFAAAAVLSAALCVLQRNPVTAALCLVSTMFSLAAIFVLLDAQFIGAIQVLVYAGAIMVLFLFVIMLLNLDAPARDVRGPGAVTATIVVVGLLLAELGTLAAYSPRRLAEELGVAPGPPAPAPAADVVQAVAAPLFTQYLVPFQVTGLLLLAAVVGAVVLAKRRI